MTDSALPTFIAESRELLREMEAALLECEQGETGAEAVNSIFRAAHTIKGSSGLFGLDGIVAFTHVVESVLDRVRANTLQMDRTLAAILLECRDHIEHLVNAVADGKSDDIQLATKGEGLLQKLTARAGGVGSAMTHTIATTPVAPAAGREHWQINVQFHTEVLRNGMDPLSFIRYLGTLGDIVALKSLTERLPAVEEFDAEGCYLGFEIELASSESQERIEAAFEFVREDCTLQVRPQAPAAQEVAAEKREVDAKESKATKSSDGRSLRVDGDKLDKLIDLIGELVTAGATTTITARKAGLSELNESTLRLARLVEEVRDQALKLRMVQIGPTFSRFQRIVRDVAREIGKEIRLEIGGAETELDKTLIESITDPLTHLVRNAIDHGIETAEVRRARGKNVEGVVRLDAYHDSGSVVIEVADDGGGLKRERIVAKAIERGLIADGSSLTDSEAFALIFEPGFSTAEQVTNLSGRGVGMDVVKRNVNALRGTVELDSKEGEGTTVRIRLPLTLAIIDGFLVGVGNSSFVIPLELVEECVELGDEHRSPDGDQRYINLRGAVLPFVRLREMFSLRSSASRRESIVVIRCAGQRIGIVVDDLLGEMQAVIKPLSRLFSRIRGIGGSTILGTGQLALILDVTSLLDLCLNTRQAHTAPRRALMD
ncbi:chemotaxis protein CheA [Steroidobacter agaridevorans]|uniref:Chemotaxis protein CheA n=1 Tax=Steroidobacter agaridevorans TaxID=2695856 RepID=A0A829YJG9_9GAMM|nr:chemotaxis protein CheA [Steroidobacter agaridevorans]GFE83349.1 chemotaxis protein CheA [Steroidobacter agaridevorans]